MQEDGSVDSVQLLAARDPLEPNSENLTAPTASELSDSPAGPQIPPPTPSKPATLTDESILHGEGIESSVREQDAMDSTQGLDARLSPPQKENLAADPMGSSGEAASAESSSRVHGVLNDGTIPNILESHAESAPLGEDHGEEGSNLAELVSDFPLLNSGVLTSQADEQNGTVPRDEVDEVSTTFESLAIVANPVELGEGTLPVAEISLVPTDVMESTSILAPVATTELHPSMVSVIASSATPPPQSISPAPPKKFASSLSVNKKFLEKAGDKGPKPELKTAASKSTISRLATPPISTSPVSTSHPRLLTGKISGGPSLSLTTMASASGASGWVKNSLPPEGHPPPSVPPQQFNRGGPFERGRGGGMGGMGMGMSGRGRGTAVWGSRGQSGFDGMNMGIGGDFPTAAEAANAKRLRAQQLVEAMQSRDRAVQARAQAAAEANAHLLERLDAFRGVHLDPNASHWDEMGDEDFLDDTIEFGDGTQYKIDAEVAVPLNGGDEFDLHAVENDELREPHPSDFATLEAPLAPGESLSEPTREERFQDDYDRTYGTRTQPVVGGGDAAKTLFNDRLGRLEPYAGRQRGAPVPESILAKASEQSHGPPSSSTAPKRDTTSTWGRGEAPRGGPATAVRRPSMDQGPARPRLPSLDNGGKHLPPHMRGDDQRRQPQTQKEVVRNEKGNAPVTTSNAAPAPPAVPVESIEEMHAKEMHAAAERAKIRRQEDEQKRLDEQKERAAKKMAELEEKMRLASEAKAAAKLAANPPSASSNNIDSRKVTEDVSGRKRSLTNGVSAGEKQESWRERATKAPPIAVPVTPAKPSPVNKPEPTQILARKSLASAPTPPANAVPGHTPKVHVNSKPLSPDTAKRVLPESQSSMQPLAKAGVAQERIWRRAEALAQDRQGPPTATKPAGDRNVPVKIIATRGGTTLPTNDIDEIGHSSSQAASATPHVRKATFGTDSPHKNPAMSNLEHVMAKIKGAMGPPAKPVTSVETDSKDPQKTGPIFTVKIPSISTSTSNQVSTTEASPEPMIIVQLPSGIKPVAEVSRKPIVQPSHNSTGGKGRTDFSQKAAPVFEDREPARPFDRTRHGRSQSPPPPWKVYRVRLSPYPSMLHPQPKQLRAFFSPQSPVRVNILSWDPPIVNLNPRRISRDDLFFHRGYGKGVVSNIPLNRILRRTIVEYTIPVNKSSADKGFTVNGDKLGRIRARNGEWDASGDNPDHSRWRLTGDTVGPTDMSSDEYEVNSSPFDATTAPGADFLFDSTPAKPVSKRANPVVDFYRHSPEEEAHSMSTIPPESTQMLLTSALNGELVEVTPRKSLAAPGAEVSSKSLKTKTSQTLSSDRPSETHHSSSRSWTSNPPLSLSVLDPTAPSVWSAPLNDAPVHARTVSLSGPKAENSLQGISDPDDFPAASIPNSLAELRTEDDSMSHGGSLLKSPSKDDARLRAAAPSFLSYQDERSPEPRAMTHDFTNRYSVYDQYPSESAGRVASYGYTTTPHSHLQSHAYPAYSSQQPSSSAYSPVSSAYQTYSNSSFNRTPSSSYSHLSPVYRGSTQAITNPALIAQQGYGSSMSYGAVGGGSYGAVGAGGGSRSVSSYGRSPLQAYGTPLPQSGGGYPDLPSYRETTMGSPPESRATSFGGYGIPSPVLMAPHHPHSSYSQQSYGTAFSPQFQNLHPSSASGRVSSSQIPSSYRRPWTGA